VQASASKTRPAGTYGAFADEAIFRKPRNSPETEQGLACSPQTQSIRVKGAATMNHHQQQIDHLILASSTIAAQFAELKALRKQVEEWSDHISRQTGSAYAKPACGPAG
jgi:hypothetical protein